jgi:hypothetical protein
LDSGVGRGDTGPPLGVDRIPQAAADPLGIPFDAFVRAAVDVAVQTLAVDAHRAGHDHAPDGLFDQLLEQHGGAELVDAGVAVDLVHGLAHADLGREVDHAVHAFERAFDGRLVPDIADLKLDVTIELGRPTPIPVDLLDEAVQTRTLSPRANRAWAT